MARVFARAHGIPVIPAPDFPRSFEFTMPRYKESVVLLRAICPFVISTRCSPRDPIAPVSPRLSLRFGCRSVPDTPSASSILIERDSPWLWSFLCSKVVARGVGLRPRWKWCTDWGWFFDCWNHCGGYRRVAIIGFKGFVYLKFETVN